VKTLKPPKSCVLEADVVVIGGGAAGLPAAVTAIEKGANSVILIEKRLALGGNASRAEGVFGVESPVQRREMVFASSDDIYKKIMNWHHYSRIDPLIFRAYLKKSGDTIAWLEQKGIVFTLGTRTRFRFDQNPVWHIPEGKCAAIVKTLSQNCKNIGVQILTRTAATKILLNSRGSVSGVLARKGDEDISIKAKSVIISTGGFVGNKKLLNKYFPYYNDTFFTATLPLTGDGVKLASDAGGVIEDYACMLKETGFGASPLTFSLIREPYLMCVNKTGKRFLDEDSIGFYPMECGNVMIRQPGMVYYAIFDDKIAQDIEKQGFLLGRPGVHRGEAGEPIPGFREELKAGSYKDWVKISDSLTDIAEWIGAKTDILKASLEEYNSFCDRGYDATFVKDRKYLLPLRTPPYYATRVQPMITDTIGPVRINEKMEVLNKKSDPVPGLYAAGVITSGWQSEEYCSEICGSAMGFSLNSGRIAAENAVKFATDKYIQWVDKQKETNISGKLR
jgi:fumarate reductase flavoprotein subunit